MIILYPKKLKETLNINIMKTIKILFITVLASLVSTIVVGQEKKKKTTEINFNVNGICEMCKDRIENALDVKGIKFSEWNVETHNCTVVYKPTIISEKEIHQLIADVGHDTDSIKATEEVYKNIHHCCKYRD